LELHVRRVFKSQAHTGKNGFAIKIQKDWGKAAAATFWTAQEDLLLFLFI